MTQDLIELLDRQFAFLMQQQGAAFLRELRRTLKVLQHEPRLAALLDDERQSAVALVARFEEHEQRFIQKLVELRNDLIKLAKGIDDSNTPSPQGDAAHWEFDKWFRTLAAFDKIASGAKYRVVQDAELDKSQVNALITVLNRKISDTQSTSTEQDSPQTTENNQGPEFDTIQQRLSQIRDEHMEVWRIFYDEVLTQPGAHLLYLEDLVARMSKEWSYTVQRNPQLEVITGLLRLPNEYSFKSLLYDRLDYSRKTEKDPEKTEDILKLRPVVERVYQGLRLRIGTTRSLIALFNRFRTRCQYHDRERLHQLAKQPPSSLGQRAQRNQRRSRAEQALTEELARYLFDQGLNPLTEVPTAGLRPDVLEPGHLYVEAKQYGDSRNPRSYLLKGAHQVHETMGRLRGSRYQVHEAFYVVFRLGGLRVDFPETVSCGDWTLYPILIDLAPASESGSRAKAPIVITADELHPRATVTPARQRRRQ